MGMFNEDELQLVDGLLGLGERAAIGTCLLGTAGAMPTYLAHTLAPGALSWSALLLQAFVLPLLAGLLLIASDHGGLARWLDAAKNKPAVLGIVALPALALTALVPLL
jgi:hypothetical protein